MKSYTETVLLLSTQDIFRAAVELVAALPDPPEDHSPWRCHEVARVVGKRIGFRVVDGCYGAVDHSWIVIADMGYNAVLDVYAVGSLPQVRLLDMRPTLPHAKLYRPGKLREDILEADITFMERALDAAGL